jgi:DNA-binding protein
MIAEDGIVFIGKKPSNDYVLAVVSQFNTGINTVTLKARGRAISRAVDVAEIVRNRFVRDARIGSIEIGTQNMEDDDRSEGVNVSWIEIVMVRD